MSRAELLEKGETTADHIKNQREESDKVDQDKKNEHPREGGLFRGAFGHPPITQPIVDLEDNVIRCPQCGWELEDDVECEHCGYIGDLDSDAGDSQWSGTEENSEMADFLDEEAQDDFDGADAFHGDHGIFASFFPLDLSVVLLNPSAGAIHESLATVKTKTQNYAMSTMTRTWNLLSTTMSMSSTRLDRTRLQWLAVMGSARRTTVSRITAHKITIRIRVPKFR